MVALVAGCSTSARAPDGPGPGDAGAADAGPGLDVTMTAHLTPGTDTYRCKYVAMPGDQTTMTGASHTSSLGVHHVLVFRTDLAAVPPGGDVERDCFTADDVMPHARAQIYGSQAKTGAFTLPPGVGLPLHGGEVLLVQVHDQDASATDLDATVSIHLEVPRDAPVTQRAGTFFFADPFIDVAVGQKGRASMGCAFPSDATILDVSGYAHAHATDFAAYVDPPGQAPTATPFYRAPGSGNPLPLQTSLSVPAGARVRVECVYDDTRGSAEILQGTRYDADEQCVLSGVYYPELGDDVDACRVAPEGFGTGNATCAQTRACVDACSVGSAPPADLGLGRAGPIDPCWQRCIAASCTDASQLLFALRACQAASPQDPCATEAAACDADACR
jgi:hypothetical protein